MKKPNNKTPTFLATEAMKQATPRKHAIMVTIILTPTLSIILPINVSAIEEDVVANKYNVVTVVNDISKSSTMELITTPIQGDCPGAVKIFPTVQANRII